MIFVYFCPEFTIRPNNMPNKESALARRWKRLRSYLKTHTGLTVIILAAILLQGISAVQYYYTRSLLADELEKRAESELSIKAVVVKNLLNMSENSLSGHIWDLKRNIVHPDSSYHVMEWVLRSHANLTGCWVAYVPDYFPEKGRLFEPFAWWDHGEIKYAEIAAEGRDYTQNRYYKTVHTTNAPMWTDVYREVLTGMDLVTYIVPIHDDKEDIVAMFGLDMSTSLLSDTLDYRHIYPSSYVFLLTEEGRLIAGPQHKKEKRQKEMQQIIKMINDSKPYISSLMPAPWDGIVTALITLILVAPFLWMLMRQGNSDDARALWSYNRFSQAKLVALQFLRLFIAAAFVSYILGRTIHWGYTPSILIVIAIIFSIVFSPSLRKHSEQINQTFTENLAQRKE